MNGNTKCPCGSGKKFKKCCRNAERPAETCFFCKRTETKEAPGKYTILEGKDAEGNKTEATEFVCDECYEKRQPKGGADALLMMFGAMMWGKMRR